MRQRTKESKNTKININGKEFSIREYINECSKLLDEIITVSSFCSRIILNEINFRHKKFNPKEDRENVYLKFLYDAFLYAKSICLTCSELCFTQSYVLLRPYIECVASLQYAFLYPEKKEKLIDNIITKVTYNSVSSHEKEIMRKGVPHHTYIRKLEYQWTEIKTKDGRAITIDDLLKAIKFDALFGYNDFLNQIIHHNISIYFYTPNQVNYQLPFDIVFLVFGSLKELFTISLNDSFLKDKFSLYMKDLRALENNFLAFIKKYSRISLRFVWEIPD